MATSPFKFLQEVREETRKVTWPSRKETMITTAMVFVMVAIASVFFLIADQIIRLAVAFVLDANGWQQGFSGVNPVSVLVVGAVLALLAGIAWGIKKR